MTAAVVVRPRSPAVSGFVMEAFRREPVFAGAALGMLVLALPLVAAMAFDGRSFHGVDLWSKPLKFASALAIYLGTLAWYAGWLPEGVTARRRYRIYAGAVVAACVAEMVWIAGAAANGTASHFNRTTPLMIALYAAMGLSAVFLTSASLVYGVLILRDGKSRLDPVFRLSAGVGLVLTFVLTVVVAGAMAAGSGHLVGGNLSDAEGFPLMGWARDGGDLRVAHFFATHALHVVPAFGFAAARLLPARAGRVAVAGAAALFAAFVAYTFVEALMGQPFLPLIG